MPNIKESLLLQLNALNNWLGEVYGEETSFSTLLIDSGFSELEN